MNTPATPDELARYDDLPPSEAAALAWTEYPDADRATVEQTLARALDRLVEYEQTPPSKRRPHIRRQPPMWQANQGSGDATPDE